MAHAHYVPKRRHIFTVFAIAGAAVQAASAPDLPIPKVPEGHPRVYVRPADVTALRKKVELPEFAAAWDSVKTRAAMTGKKKKDVAFCKALVYLVTSDRATCRAAIEEALANLRKATPLWNGKLVKDGRPMCNHMHMGACVYDWCYDLLTDEEKSSFIVEFKDFFAKDHDRGYPPKEGKLNAIVGHDSEGCIMTNLLPAGVAVYDEEPELYDLAARIFFTRYIEPRTFHYRSHMHHQGHHYHAERFAHDQLTSWLFLRMAAGEVLSREQRYVAYEFLYFLRPDRKFFASGDGGDDAGTESMKRVCLGLTGAYYRDPYLLTLFDDPKFYARGFLRFVDLLFLEPGLERRPLSELPKTKYFGSPMGDMLARTGWDTLPGKSRDAAVQMRIGEYYFGNHHHSDFGTFQIHYRGPLAIDTGIYWGSKETCYGSPHWRNYYIRTLAHNGLMIFDPKTAKEDFGGQIRPLGWRLRGKQRPTDAYRLGQVLGHSFGPDAMTPEFSFLSGDITRAYGETKAKRVRRAMAALNTGGDGFPLVFAVFDEVVAAQPDFKKAWYLHCIQEPQVVGRRATIVRDGPSLHGGQYGGQLVVASLLPQEASLVKVGGPGKECWNEVTGENYMPKTNRRPKSSEIGAWRIEVVPSQPAAEHRFLHVMTTMDKGAPAPPVLPIRSGDAVGARVLNRAVVFRPVEQAAEAIAFDLPGEGDCGVLVCGVSPGPWSVALPGRETVRLDVSADAGCAYFHAAPGRCEFTPARDPRPGR